MSEPLITPDLVRLGVQVTGDKHAVIAQMAELVASTGRADRAGLQQAFEDREAQFATGMPGGIAIPHCRSAAVHEAALGLIRLATPVDFGSKDGPADLIIGIAAPEGSGSEHMKLLAKLSRSLIKADFVAALRAARTPEQASELIRGVVDPAPAAAGGAAPAANQDATVGATPDAPVLLAITSCPTGIAHTYMAAESLEQAAKDKGVELHVETQGSGGITPFDPDTIKRAQALIIAADVNITGRDRFAGMPLVESGVKRAISEGPKMIDEAVAAIHDPNADHVEGSSGSSAPSSSAASSGHHQVGWGKRIQQAVMTGVSYMIPFVAAGGLLTALAFLVGGYDVAFVSNDVATKFSLWNLPDPQTYVQNGVDVLTTYGGLRLYLGAVLSTLGGLGMGFLVAALSGYIAFGLAGRPGIAPGFIGGAVSVLVGAGFIGGLVTGIFAGLVAAWFASLKAPRWLAGLMPVVIIPLLTTLVVGGIMVLFLGRPLASLMTWLQDALTSMTGASAVLLGIILGLMMCFDLGGPVNKAAYLFATAGLSAGTEASWQIMAAVMASGMVPPLAMALSTAVRPKLYTPAERENGTTAWLLGAAFISEGAIPFAAADPLRVIPSMMAGGAVTGALTMALGVESRAPHGGIFVAFAITPVWAYVVAIVAGVLVSALAVTALKQYAARSREAAAQVTAA